MLVRTIGNKRSIGVVRNDIRIDCPSGKKPLSYILTIQAALICRQIRSLRSFSRDDYPMGWSQGEKLLFYKDYVTRKTHYICIAYSWMTALKDLAMVVLPVL